MKDMRDSLRSVVGRSEPARAREAVSTAGTLLGTIAALGALVVVVFLLPAAASDGAFHESGDVGQDMNGAPMVEASAITGHLDGTGGDRVDLYRICVSDPGGAATTPFRASTDNATTQMDTSLFLFDATGAGIWAAGDVSMRNTHATLVDGALPVGEYFLGVSVYGADPAFVDGSGNRPLIFGFTGIGQKGPIHAGAPLASWAGGAVFRTGDYRIELTGVGPCAQTMTADVDVSPDDDQNKVNARAAKGVVTVAVFTTASFDATTVDDASLRLGDAAIAHKHSHLEDVDGDGDADLVAHFRVGDIGLDDGTDEVCVTGTQQSGEAFEGCDTVDVR